MFDGVECVDVCLKLFIGYGYKKHASLLSVLVIKKVILYVFKTMTIIQEDQNSDINRGV